ncbi:11441_t:CDS:2, partial [Entrophospora sp. SA101]
TKIVGPEKLLGSYCQIDNVAEIYYASIGEASVKTIKLHYSTTGTINTADAQTFQHNISEGILLLLEEASNSDANAASVSATAVYIMFNLVDSLVVIG